MIRELAEFEHALEQVRITPEDVLRDSSARTRTSTQIADWNGQPAAYALLLYLFDWAARRSLYVEDLFVVPTFAARASAKR